MATLERSLAADAMMEIAQRHERLELLFDFDELLETLVDNPLYYWFPSGLRIEGTAAVLEMYHRLQPMIAELAEATRNGTRVMDYFACGESQIAAEVQFDYRFADGTARHVRIAAFVAFADGRMVGETQYVDRFLAAEIERLLGDDFINFAGVSRI